MKKIFLTILFVGISMPAFALIDNLPDTVVSRDIGEVVVVANMHQSVIAPQSLSGLQLQKLSSHSVADAVRYFSGAQVKDYGGVGGLKTIDIRSMGSSHLGVFFDGIQVGNAQNGTVDLGRFSLDNIEEIAVYNGQKSDIFQAAKDYSTSSSVYLRTHKPLFIEGKKCNVRGTFRSGSFGLVNPAVVVENKITDKLSFSGNAEYTQATGKYKFKYHKQLQLATGDKITTWDTTGIRQNGDVRAFRLEGTLFAPQWHVKCYYYNSERGIPCAIVRNVWTSSQRQWDQNLFFQGQFQTQFSNDNAIKVAAKYSYDYMRYLDPDTTSLYIDNNFSQQDVYSSVAYLMNCSKYLSANVSVDYERNWMQSNLVNFPLPKRNMLLAALATAFMAKNVKMQVSLLGNFINDATTDGSSWTVRYTPAFFISTSVNKNFATRAFFKRMFRMPTFNDLYYTEIGNVSLKPEYATQYNIGFSFDKIEFNNYLTRIKIDVDAYLNQIDDKIVAVPKGNSQFRWMMMNIGKVRVKGADFKCQINGNNDVFDTHLLFTYTYQKAQDLTHPDDNGPRGTYKGQISYVPEHSGSVVGGVGYDGFDLNYSFIYVGERYHVSANIPENYEPSWYTHDLTLSKIIEIKNAKTLRIAVEANNLLNQQYDVVLNYPMPGRNFKAIITIRI